jgi:hypothetical protein
MCRYPPPKSQPAGSPAAGVKRKKNNNFIHSAPPQACSRPNRDCQKLWHSLRQLTYQAV